MSTAVATLTLSANATSSKTGDTLTFAPNVSAAFAQYQNLVNAALTDGWHVEVCTIYKAWALPFITNDPNRLALNGDITSTYGGGTVAGVQVCDVAANLPFTATDDPGYYFDHTHLNYYGNMAKCDFIDATLRAQYSSLMTGPIWYPGQYYGTYQSQLPQFNNLVVGYQGTNPSAITLSGSAPQLAFPSAIYKAASTGHSFYMSASGGNHADVFVSATGDLIAFPRIASGTTVSGSTSGTATFYSNSACAINPTTLALKETIVYCSALVGTASFTFPAAYTNTPVVLTTSGPAASVVTSLSATAMTVTGSTTSGYLIVIGN